MTSSVGVLSHKEFNLAVSLKWAWLGSYKLNIILQHIGKGYHLLILDICGNIAQFLCFDFSSDLCLLSIHIKWKKGSSIA